jgi:hypothetical protein
MMPTISQDSPRPERSKTVEKPGVGTGHTHQQFISRKASGIPCCLLDDTRTVALRQQAVSNKHIPTCYTIYLPYKMIRRANMQRRHASSRPSSTGEVHKSLSSGLRPQSYFSLRAPTFVLNLFAVLRRYWVSGAALATWRGSAWVPWRGLGGRLDVEAPSLLRSLPSRFQKSRQHFRTTRELARL